MDQSQVLAQVGSLRKAAGARCDVARMRSLLGVKVANVVLEVVHALERLTAARAAGPAARITARALGAIGTLLLGNVVESNVAAEILVCRELEEASLPLAHKGHRA